MAGTIARESGTPREDVHQLVEWYLSDANLQRDLFFYKLLSEADDGYIPLAAILNCPKMKKLQAGDQALVKAVEASDDLELRWHMGVYELRRNRPLPLQGRACTCKTPEASLAEVPLELLRDAGPQGAGEWESVIEDVPRRSFCCMLRSSCSAESLHADFEAVRDSVAWTKLANRSTAWLLLDPSGTCTCSYTYAKTTVESAPMPAPVRDVCSRCFARLGLPPQEWPDAANLNWYEDGQASIGWHADDEKMFDGKTQDCRIISYSLGTPRLFEVAIADRLSAQGDVALPIFDTVKRIELRSGDICTMEGLFQKHYLHSVPKSLDLSAVVGPRINITFRWIRRHRAACPRANSEQQEGSPATFAKVPK